MYAVNHIDSFEILVRKRVVGFTERLKVSENSIISCIDTSWKMQFEIWNPWIKLLYNNNNNNTLFQTIVHMDNKKKIKKYNVE